MKSYLLAQQTPETGPGTTKEWLVSRHIEFDHIILSESKEKIDFSGYQKIILCGGEPNVDQEDQFPWLIDVKENLKQLLNQKDTKIVGLCLGAQLCAEALGAQVFKNPKGWEIGWYPTQYQNEMTSFFQYHRYVFDLPQNAISLAENDWWKCQAFQWNNKVLAFQFHPEADQNWIAGCYEELTAIKKGRCQLPSEIQKLNEQNLKKTQVWYFKQLDLFFEIC